MADSTERFMFWRTFWWYFCYLPGGQFIYYHFGHKLLRKNAGPRRNST